MTETGGIDPLLLSILRCPKPHHASLDLVPAPGGGGDVELVCTECGAAYPVRDGMPVMLIDEAREPG